MVLKTKTRPAFLAAFLMLITFAASAQNKAILKDSTPEQLAKMQTEWMQEKLGLSTTQTAQVYDVNLQYARKNAPLLQSTAGKRSRFKKLKALQEEKLAALGKILDADQYKNYEALRKQMLNSIKESRK
ncbi:hypothetical protein HF324_06030 [Chitinophaga oryzae]|uniref:DUF4890 domain-containing protein n=1 Tax=Chitinophaga oryzae TaxID=2725414 RepID=A0AAE7D7E4_9BACT|nr:hypothetical protein [Chitinophaga oryzae]QJB30946.1 hypothetical protein HF329_06365 [Chitinophaga oryzae]QJB37435.1 hypothetical protein HF324_06030 [Chitinophaga oryzae]